MDEKELNQAEEQKQDEQGAEETKASEQGEGTAQE
jgi:hypothetical protein